MASSSGTSKAVPLGNRQEVSHLPELGLCIHLLNISEKEGTDYFFHRQIVSFEAIIASSI